MSKSQAKERKNSQTKNKNQARNRSKSKSQSGFEKDEEIDELIKEITLKKPATAYVHYITEMYYAEKKKKRQGNVNRGVEKVPQ